MFCQAPGRVRRPDGDVELPGGEAAGEKLPDGLPRRPDGDVELSAGMKDFVVPPYVLCTQHMTSCRRAYKLY